jgi:hypothetical protein
MYKTQNLCEFRVILDLDFEFSFETFYIHDLVSKIQHSLQIECQETNIFKNFFLKKKMILQIPKDLVQFTLKFSWNIIGRSFKILQSVHCFDKFGKETYHISEKNQREFSQIINKETIVGLRVHKDELFINLNVIPDNVHGIVFKTETFNKSMNYIRVENSNLAAISQSKEIFKMELKKSFSRSMIWGKLIRNEENWEFHVIDEPGDKVDLSTFIELDEYKLMDQEIEKLEMEREKRKILFLEYENKFNSLNKTITETVKENDKIIRKINKECQVIQSQKKENEILFQEFKTEATSVVEQQQQCLFFLKSKVKSPNIKTSFDEKFSEFQNVNFKKNSNVEINKLPENEQKEFLELKKELFQ